MKYIRFDSLLSRAAVAASRRWLHRAAVLLCVSFAFALPMAVAPGNVHAADADAAGATQAQGQAQAGQLPGDTKSQAEQAPRVQRTAFDHLTTGFELTGKHRDLPCESCHVNAIFKGTPHDCASCHGVGTQVRATAKPVNHILTTNRCDGCHTPVAFDPAVNFDHAEVRGTCSSCHFAGGPAQGKPVTHIDTNLECDACHSTIGWSGALGATVPANHIPINTGCGTCHTDSTNWKLVVMNHTGITGNCAQCHAAGNTWLGNPKSPPADHVPFGSAACESCHLASSTSTGGFAFTNAATSAPAGMVHSMVSALACSTCHASGKTWVGTPATVTTPANHVAIAGAECSTCHVVGTSFHFTNASGTAPPSMVHSAVASLACSSCHESGKADVGVPATVVRPALKANGQPHVTGGECSTCHFNTTSFKGATDLPANHLPVPAADNSDCSLCHTNPNNFSTATMNHVNIASNCAQCHATGLAFANMAPPVLVQPPTNHVPFGSAACESCHLATSTATGGFKFTSQSTSAPAGMVHSAVGTAACATCHASGNTWLGSPMPPPAKHVPFGSVACESCHLASSTATGGFQFTSASTSAPAGMVHSAVASQACATCHASGNTWVGSPMPPPANHVPFGSTACESCHLASSTATGGFKFTSTSTTAPAGMVHSAVSSQACSSCHASGNTWLGAPLPPPTDHIPFGSAACESCHLASSTATGGFTFTNASGTAPPAMIHSAVASTACDMCHGAGKTFAGTPATKVLPATGHVPFPAGTACTACHSASNFNTFVFTNASTTATPGMVHTAVSSIACSTCHEAGKSWLGTPSTVVRPATKANGQLHVSGGECSVCHLNTVSFKGATDLPASHLPVPAADNNDCSLCHGSLNDFSLATTMNHVNITSNCAQCHAAGKSFLNMAPPTLVVTPANHVPFGTAACESCHLASSTSTGGFKFASASTTTPAGMVHSAVSSQACATCHASGNTWLGAPMPPPANHVPFGTAACESCHLASGTATGGFKFTSQSTTTPAGMVHAAVSSQACATCHASSNTWLGSPMPPPANHVPFGTAACESCHSSTSTATGGFVFTNASGTTPPAMVHSAVASTACDQCHAAGKTFVGTPATRVVPANHVPFPAGTACTGCHTATNFTTFVITNASTTAPAGMVHSLVTSIACSTCHEAGLTWAGTPATKVRPALKADGTAHVTGGECSTCHFNTTSFKGATDLPANHIPLPAADNNNCSLCHSNLNNYSTATMNHVNIASNCAQCHAAGLSFANMAPPVLVQPPTNHVPFGTAACESCHLASSTSTGGFKFTNASGSAPPAMVHASVASTSCDTCHAAGKSFVGTPATKVVPANHVPFPAGTACTGCHSGSDFSTFVFTNASTTAPTGMVHTLVASIACSTCHEAGKSWVGSPATKVRPALKANGQAHVSGGECSTCHFNTTSFLGATDLPANHLPVPAADNNNCALCHSNSSDYSIGTMNHVNITANCAQCHAAGLSFANMAPPTLVLPPANHVPFGTAACESCHLASSTATGGFKFTNASGTTPAAMVHAGVSSIACDQCHAAGKTWAGTPATVVVGTTHIPFPASVACTACHSATNFTTFKITSASTTSAPGMVHSVVTSMACAACHASGNTWQGTPMPPPTTHVPFGTTACESCHLASSTATGGWKFTNASTTAPAGMVHTAIPATITCDQCHAAGKTFVGTPATKVVPSNHIPFGTAACTACHSATNFTIFVFTNASGTAPSAMVHSAVSTISCDQCHAAGKTFIGTPATKVVPANHVPFGTAACTGCHLASSTATGGFVFTNASTTAPAGMVHSLVTSIVCSTCHEAGKTWAGTPATKVRPALKADGTAHVAAGECSTCHFNTTSFKGATDLPANHIPLPAADKNNCALCHLTAGNYSIATMNHVNITSNCIQCHGYGLSFANMAPPTLVQPPAGATGHIPSNKPNGTSDIACELCHSATVFTKFSGTIMKHAQVKAMTCMSCHEIGMAWKTNTGVRLWVRDSANHHKGQDCGGSGCHTAQDKFVPRRAVALAAGQKAGPAPTLNGGSGGSSAVLGGGAGFSHLRLGATPCASCHTAAAGMGKPVGHIATSEACSSCHDTVAWMPVQRVDHTQVVGTCASCHDGRTAPGKATAHVASNNDCAACHTTVAFSPARFDHAAVAAHTCLGCHDSVHASGKPLNHVPTMAQCDTCHGVLGWKPAKMDHATLTASCATCHDNRIALGVPVGHIGTQRDCATCHSYPDWAVSRFVHASASYPGNHVSAPACVACHKANTDQIAWASPADAATCGGCHASDFRPALHPKTKTGVNYTASELHNCSGACHVYTDETLGTVSKSLPGPYHKVSDAAFKH